MRIRFLALIAATTLLSACLESNVPDRSPTEAPDSKAPINDLPLLQDPDGNPILEVPIEILQDVRKQMLEKGLNAHAKNLEEVYDFQTGKARSSGPALSK